MVTESRRYSLSLTDISKLESEAQTKDETTLSSELAVLKNELTELFVRGSISKVVLDGLAGVGKGDILKLFKQYFPEITIISSGEFFRIVSFFLQRIEKANQGLSVTMETLADLFHQLTISMDYVGGQVRYHVLHPGISPSIVVTSQDLHTPEIDSRVSRDARLPVVRDFVADLQRVAIESFPKGVIIDSRDGYALFGSDPDITLLYLYAQKRPLMLRELLRSKKINLEQYQVALKRKNLLKGPADYEAFVLARNVLKRNKADQSREKDPLLTPAAAKRKQGTVYQGVIDTSELNQAQVFWVIMKVLLHDMIAKD